MNDSILRSGRAVGEDYVERVRRYLDSNPTLPTRQGELDMTALASVIGIPRQSLYKNPGIRPLIEQMRSQLHPLMAEQPVPAPGSKSSAAQPADDVRSAQLHRLERRVMALEQHNAALVAENAELRRQLRELRTALGRDDMMIESGRRIATPPVQP